MNLAVNDEFELINTDTNLSVAKILLKSAICIDRNTNHRLEIGDSIIVDNLEVSYKSEKIIRFKSNSYDKDYLLTDRNTPTDYPSLAYCILACMKMGWFKYVPATHCIDADADWALSQIV